MLTSYMMIGIYATCPTLILEWNKNYKEQYGTRIKKRYIGRNFYIMGIRKLIGNMIDETMFFIN
jgi:hypothetical protein